MDLLIKMTSMSDIETPSGCWEWKRAKSKGGYGQLWVPPKVKYVHRLSYELHKGEIPDGRQIDHICRNRTCWNPDHLRLATQAQNSQNVHLRASNTSGSRGVCWNANARKWQARLQKDGKAIYLGLFTDLREADAAVTEARRKHFPYSEMDKV